MKWWKGNGDRVGMWYGYWWVEQVVSRGHRALLGCIVFPIRVDLGPFVAWTLVKSHTYYPKHILAYGRGKTCYSFIMGSDSFQTDWLEAGIGGGLSTTLRSGLKCGGLESKFGRGLGTLNMSGTGWSRLCLGCKRGVCFLGYPAGHINSWIAVSTWRYDLTTF
jgi:hypothetical protein